MKIARAITLLILITLLMSCTKSSLVSDDVKPNDEIIDKRDTIEFWHTYSDIETKVFEEQILPLIRKGISEY